MSTEIVTALIVAGGSIICQLLINASNRKRQESENEKTKSLIVYRLELEHKQDKYNHLQERVFKLERMSAVTDEEIRVVNHRIADLEHINSEKK